jgi:hypothetical protein
MGDAYDRYRAARIAEDVELHFMLKDAREILAGAEHLPPAEQEQKLIASNAFSTLEAARAVKEIRLGAVA